MMISSDAIAPVVLAAGDSKRMGYPKALLPLGEDIFITRIFRILRNAGFPKPAVILGKAASIIQAQIHPWPADIWINPDPDKGQLSSIQLAISHLRSEFTGFMVWPVDHPAVSEDLVRRLSELFVRSESKITLPLCGSQHGHPAIFHRDLIQEFMDAPAEEGPKMILLRHRHATAALPTPESASIQDIDNPEDYLRLTGESMQSALARLNASGISQS